MIALDHVVYAAPDLEAACAAFAEATGCEPAPGGPHVGLGTRNALVSFGDGCYLEIIAPDPAQPAAPNLGASLERLAAPELFHWALRVDDLDALATALRQAGLETTPPRVTRRTLPTGGVLTWALTGLPGRGGAWPFFIDWRDCPHPSEDAPRVGRLEHLHVSLPVDDPAPLPFANLDRIVLVAGPPALFVRFRSERGVVDWKRDAPTGFFG